MPKPFNATLLRARVSACLEKKALPCSEAKGGQILTNQKTLTTVEESAQVEPLGEVTLHGMSHPVRVFNAIGFSESATRSIADLRSVGDEPSPELRPLARAE